MDADEIASKIREIEAELHKLRNQFRLGEDAYWKADLETRKSFAMLRSEIQDLKKEVVAKFDFLDSKFTRLVEGLEDRFDIFRNTIQGVVALQFKDERAVTRKIVQDAFLKEREITKKTISDAISEALLKEREVTKQMIAEALIKEREVTKQMIAEALIKEREVTKQMIADAISEALIKEREVTAQIAAEILEDKIKEHGLVTKDYLDEKLEKLKVDMLQAMREILQANKVDENKSDETK